MPSLRHQLRELLGPRAYAWLQARRRGLANRLFRWRQGTARIVIGPYELSAPSGHILRRLQREQPYRDQGLGVVARALGARYPGQQMLDIGANIGDTAAILAAATDNPLVLVEPSDYYRAFLVANARQWPTVRRIEAVLVSDQPVAEGILVHQGGTARFEPLPGAGQRFAAKRLDELADDQTCLIKLDTDGHDAAILLASLPYLARRRPALLCEVSIESAAELAAADHLVDALAAAGYAWFVLWDDAGLHLLSTGDPAGLHDLHRYLYKLTGGRAERGIYNYDLLALADADRDAYDAVRRHYREY
jgi:FkbM family methyltransferase